MREMWWRTGTDQVKDVWGEGGIAASEPCSRFADADGKLVVFGNICGVELDDVTDGGGVCAVLCVAEGRYVEDEGTRHVACREDENVRR